ncbi:hypothetical protein KEM52_004463 [Ascosphaera acerosa]|nr:hypothetical protein KEM52_004463 [Ascosphaera acerosa]
MASLSQPFYESPIVDAKTSFPVGVAEEMFDDSMYGMISPDMSPKDVRRPYSQDDSSIPFDSSNSETWGEPSQLPVQISNGLDQTPAQFQTVGLAGPQQWATPAPSLLAGSPGFEWPQADSSAYAGGVAGSGTVANPMFGPPGMQHRQSYSISSLDSEPRDWSASCPNLTEPPPQTPPFGKPAIAYGRLSTASSSAAAAAALGIRFRGDGIRKKNARFDIPAEVNLDTVDRLISQASDETHIKELKQQKRLLRNRQAALDSRLRKKQHTEQLEGDMKAARMTIQQLRSELDCAKRREEAQHAEHVMLARQNAELQHLVEELKAERSREVHELEQTNATLRYQVDKYAQSSAAEAGFGGMGSPWPDFDGTTDDVLRAVAADVQTGFAAAAAATATADLATPGLSPSSSPSVSVAETASSCKGSESPFSWDVVGMCLLVGALVASRSDLMAQPAVSLNYQEQAKRLVTAAAGAPRGNEPTNDLLTGQPLFLQAAITSPTRVSRQALQQALDGLSAVTPKTKPAVSQRMLEDFKVLVTAAAASAAAQPDSLTA